MIFLLLREKTRREEKKALTVTGLRQGEQAGLKPDDIDWSKGLLHVRRAITKDDKGNTIEGSTKNKYSRRTIKLTLTMKRALLKQKQVYDSYKGEYFFCNTKGGRIDPGNLTKNVWLPALKQSGLKVREMKQTRHSFATVALNVGESHLWIAKVLGHRNTEMVIKVYAKYVENISGSNDGSKLDELYSGGSGK